MNFINGLNLYNYCNCNPVSYIDLYGDAWWHWLIGALVVVVAAVAVVVTAGGVAAGIAAVSSVLAGGAATTIWCNNFCWNIYRIGYNIYCFWNNGWN